MDLQVGKMLLLACVLCGRDGATEEEIQCLHDAATLAALISSKSVFRQPSTQADVVLQKKLQTKVKSMHENTFLDLQFPGDYFSALRAYKQWKSLKLVDDR